MLKKIDDDDGMRYISGVRNGKKNMHGIEDDDEEWRQSRMMTVTTTVTTRRRRWWVTASRSATEPHVINRWIKKKMMGHGGTKLWRPVDLTAGEGKYLKRKIPSKGIYRKGKWWGRSREDSRSPPSYHSPISAATDNLMRRWHSCNSRAWQRVKSRRLDRWLDRWLDRSKYPSCQLITWQLFVCRVTVLVFSYKRRWVCL